MNLKPALKIISLLFFILGLMIISSQLAAAVSCANVPISGNYTVDTACNFANTVDGVDAGTGTANTAVLTSTTGGSLTVGAGTTLAVGSLSLTGGNIIIINTGQIKIGAPLYATDADADAYPASITAFYTSAASGRVRRNSLASLAVDCNDAQTCVDGTYPATCKKCNSGCIVNEANGSTGYNCTAIHYRCDGGGGCTAPIVESGCVGAASGHDANWKCITYLGYDMCRRSYGYADVCGGGCYSCQAAQQGCDVPFYSAVCANYVYD